MWGLDREMKRIERELRNPKLSVEMKGVLVARLHQKRRLLVALIKGFGAKPDVSARC